MNKLADSLATQHLSHPPALFVPRKLPGFKVRLLYDKSVITSKIYRTLANIKYDLELKTYILRKINWPPPTFDKIDWPAHQKAFNYLTKYQQISVAKLIHNLVNTNRQNFLYYKTSASCSIGDTQEETFKHVLTCDNTAASRHLEE